MNLDKDGLAAAHEAYAKTVGGTMEGHPMANAITAYLAALPNTGDELVARLRRAVIDGMDWAGTMPAKDAVKVRPKDWHTICDTAREAADAIASLTARAQAAEASLASAREDALEEAAKVHEAEIAMIQGHLAGDEIDQYSYSKLVLLLGSHHNSLSAIRALKEAR